MYDEFYIGDVFYEEPFNSGSVSQPITCLWHPIRCRASHKYHTDMLSYSVHSWLRFLPGMQSRKLCKLCFDVEFPEIAYVSGYSSPPL